MADSRLFCYLRGEDGDGDFQQTIIWQLSSGGSDLIPDTSGNVLIATTWNESEGTYDHAYSNYIESDETPVSCDVSTNRDFSAVLTSSGVFFGLTDATWLSQEVFSIQSYSAAATAVTSQTFTDTLWFIDDNDFLASFVQEEEASGAFLADVLILVLGRVGANLSEIKRYEWQFLGSHIAIETSSVINGVDGAYDVANYFLLVKKDDTTHHLLYFKNTDNTLDVLFIEQQELTPDSYNFHSMSSKDNGIQFVFSFCLKDYNRHIATALFLDYDGFYVHSEQIEASSILGYNENCIQTDYRTISNFYDIYETENYELVLYQNDLADFAYKKYVLPNY